MNFTTCGMINKISQWYLFAQYDPSRQGHYYHKLFVWREKFSVGKCCLFRGWNTILPQFSFYHSANCSRLKILVILRNFPQSLQTLGFFTSNHSGKVFLANVWGGFVKKNISLYLLWEKYSPHNITYMNFTLRSLRKNWRWRVMLAEFNEWNFSRGNFHAFQMLTHIRKSPKTSSPKILLGKIVKINVERIFFSVETGELKWKWLRRTPVNI